jgi:hypothetical protein
VLQYALRLQDPTSGREDTFGPFDDAVEAQDLLLVVSHGLAPQVVATIVPLAPPTISEVEASGWYVQPTTSAKDLRDLAAQVVEAKGNQA